MLPSLYNELHVLTIDILPKRQKGWATTRKVPDAAPAEIDMETGSAAGSAVSALPAGCESCTAGLTTCFRLFF